MPAERMKMEREHLVPLAPPVVELLRSVKEHSRGEFVFAGDKVGTLRTR